MRLGGMKFRCQRVLLDVWVSACVMGKGEDVKGGYLGKRCRISRCHLQGRASMGDDRRWRCLRRRRRPIWHGKLETMGIEKGASTCVPPSPGIGVLVLYHKLLWGPAIGFWSWSG